MSAAPCTTALAFGARKALPSRRGCFRYAFIHNGSAYAASIATFENGTPAEIFITAEKHNSDMAKWAAEAAICASIAFQYGVPVADLRKALARDDFGNPVTPLCAALDLFEGEYAAFLAGETP